MARSDADLRVVPGSACLDGNSALPAQQLRLNVQQSWTANSSKLRDDTDRSDADRYVSDVTRSLDVTQGIAELNMDVVSHRLECSSREQFGSHRPGGPGCGAFIREQFVEWLYFLGARVSSPECRHANAHEAKWRIYLMKLISNN